MQFASLPFESKENLDFDKRLVYVDLGQELGLSGQTLHSQNVAENRNDIQIIQFAKSFYF